MGGRRDTWSDLQLLMGINGLLVLFGGFTKRYLIDGVNDEPLGRTIYQVTRCGGRGVPEADPAGCACRQSRARGVPACKALQPQTFRSGWRLHLAA